MRGSRAARPEGHFLRLWSQFLSSDTECYFLQPIYPRQRSSDVWRFLQHDVVACWRIIPSPRWAPLGQQCRPSFTITLSYFYLNFWNVRTCHGVLQTCSTL